jgi:hypothetical protein
MEHTGRPWKGSASRKKERRLLRSPLKMKRPNFPGSRRALRVAQRPTINRAAEGALRSHHLENRLLRTEAELVPCQGIIFLLLGLQFTGKPQGFLITSYFCRGRE